MEKEKQLNKGITLIALVITIIVLLILATVSIAMLTGEHGLITKMSDAKVANERAEAEEQVRLAIIGSYDTRGKIDIEKLNENLSMIQGLKYNEKAIGEDNKIGKLPATVNVKGYDVIIGRKGDILDSEQADVLDWDDILENATTPHLDQTKSKDIGVGTDGELVNLDYWSYEKKDETGYRANRYTGTITEEGKIIGTVPQYIKAENGEFLPVVDMGGTFLSNSSLKIAPEIPNTVTTMYAFGYGTFMGCSNLTTPPKIPSSVIDMSNAFLQCTSLETTPEISDGVKNMNYAFVLCNKLKTVSKIPNSVTSMNQTFSQCTNLITAPEIPEGVTDMSQTFYMCTNLKTSPPKIPDSVTDLSETFYGCVNMNTTPEITVNSKLKDMSGAFSGCSYITTPYIPNGVTNMEYTFYSCQGLTTAPVIPSSVTNMTSTFNHCSSLSGELVINANPTKYDSCLSGANDYAGPYQNKKLFLSGSSTKLQEILNTKSSSNTTIEIKN